MTATLFGSNRYNQIDSHIGQGTYGKVEKAVDKLTGEQVAIKKVKIELKDVPLEESGVAWLNGISHTVYREIKIMRELNHVNVITVRDVFVEGDFINIVMPLMVSDLRKFLDKRLRVNESQIKCLMQQILRGVAELHRNYFLHRDLAPANIFINDMGICKVADFGLSRSYGSPRPTRKTAEVVTLWYRAPELLYGATYYQDKVDVWSVGCILAELLMGGKPLFPGQNEVDQLSRIFAVLGSPALADSGRNSTGSDGATNSAPTDPATDAGGGWPDAVNLPMYFEFSFAPRQKWADIMPLAPAPALDLLDQLLRLNPKSRITCAAALNHHWFSTPPLPCLPEALPKIT